LDNNLKSDKVLTFKKLATLECRNAFMCSKQLIGSSLLNGSENIFR